MSRADSVIRYGVVALLAATLLGTYTQLPIVSLALQAAVFAVAGVYLVAGEDLRAGSRPLGWAALAAALLLGISTLFSVDRASSLISLGQWISYGLLAWLAASVFRPPHLRLLAQYVLLLGVLMAGLAVYFYWGETGQDALPVMNSIFGNKNHFGGYLLLILPLALGLFLEARSGRERLAYGAVSVFLGSTFILTYSRGAWFAMVPALAMVAWAFRPQRAALAGRLALVGIGTVIVAFLISRSGLSRTIDLGYQGAVSVANAAAGGEDQGTLAPRLDYWQGAAQIMLDHPLTGTGPGTFDAVFPGYEINPLYYSRFAHNFFLQTGAESGVPALLAMVALFGVLAAGWARTYRREDPHGIPASLQAGLVAGLVASTLHNLVELDWYVPAIGLLFAVEAGLVLGVVRPSVPAIGRREEPISSANARAAVGAVLEPPLGVADMSLHGQKTKQYLAVIIGCALLFLASIWQWSEQLLLSQAETAPDTAAAQDRLEEAAALNPLDGEPDLRLAELHLAGFEKTGAGAELEAGIADAREALARSPARDAYRVVLARLYLSDGQLEPAIGQLESLTSRLQPLQVPQAYQQLGEAYLRLGRTADAASVYQRLLAAFPQGPDTPQPPQPGALTRDEASGLLAEAHLALGNIYTGSGEMLKAEEEYQASLALKPDSAPANFNLGTLEYRQGRWAEALVSFQQASSLDPHYAPALYYRGLAHLKLGQRDEAVADFRAALAADPNYDDARRALEGM